MIAFCDFAPIKILACGHPYGPICIQHSWIALPDALLFKGDGHLCPLGKRVKNTVKKCHAVCLVYVLCTVLGEFLLFALAWHWCLCFRTASR